MSRTPVILCSPFAGDRKRNDAYLRRCMADSLSRHEAPLASHALWTQFLDDAVPEEREVGLICEQAWLVLLGRRMLSATKFIPERGKVVAYIDLGISSGMRRAIEIAVISGVPVEQREIGA